MLDKPIEKIVMEDGHVVGVFDGKDTAKCSIVVCDPSYAADRCKKVGQVCINHPNILVLFKVGFIFNSFSLKIFQMPERENSHY